MPVNHLRAKEEEPKSLSPSPSHISLPTALEDVKLNSSKPPSSQLSLYFATFAKKSLFWWVCCCANQVDLLYHMQSSSGPTGLFKKCKQSQSQVCYLEGRKAFMFVYDSSFLPSVIPVWLCFLVEMKLSTIQRETRFMGSVIYTATTIPVNQFVLTLKDSWQCK